MEGGGRARRRRKRKGRGGGSAGEPQGRSEAEGDTARGEEGIGGAVQVTPRDGVESNAGGGGGPGGRREGHNGEAERERLRLGGLGSRQGGRNGGVEQERFGLGGLGVQPLQLAGGSGGRRGRRRRRGSAAGEPHDTLGEEDEMAGDAAGDEQAMGRRYGDAAREGGAELISGGRRNGEPTPPLAEDSAVAMEGGRKARAAVEVHLSSRTGGAMPRVTRPAATEEVNVYRQRRATAWNPMPEVVEDLAVAGNGTTARPSGKGSALEVPRQGATVAFSRKGSALDKHGAGGYDGWQGSGGAAAGDPHGMLGASDTENKKLGLGGLGSQHAEEKALLPRRTSLSDAVLSWTVKDVLDDNFYKDKVQYIPLKFNSIQHYATVHSGLLLEETKSIISSKINSIVDAQYCRLLSVKPCGSPLLLYLDIDIKATSSYPTNCYHIARDYDVCLLSTKSPRDSDFNAKVCCIGLATGIGRDIFFQKSFKVVVSHNKVLQNEKIKFVIFLSNISYRMGLSKVLSLHDESDKRAVHTLLKLFNEVGKICNSCSPSLHYKGVVATLSSRVSCPHQRYTGVVWAPPGTMNSCIPVLLKEFIHSSRKVLVCLPKKESFPMFLMNLEEHFDPNELAGFLLLNSSVMELGICSEFQKACLETKSQELYCCLVQCTGWLKWMSILLNLKAFNHSPRCPDSTKCEQCKLEFPFSVQLFNERFTDLLMKLRDSLSYLINNASALSLNIEDRKIILELLRLMENVEYLLHSTDLSDNCVTVAFGLNLCSSTMDSTGYTIESLNEHRMSCIKMIDTLIKSLQLPQLENRDEFEKFCLQHSSIIVAPLDYLEKLHDQEIDTFDILIVADSGQITESDLLIPLGLRVGHILFFGDHLHLQPFVQSKICKDAGFGVSIYEGLQKSTSEKLTLTDQYVRHPLMNKFISTLFYNKKIQDGPNVISTEQDKKFGSLGLTTIGFMDVPTTKLKPTHSGKCYINFAAIIMLLRQLSTDWTDANKKLSIGLVCFSNEEANYVGERLRNEKEIKERLHLQVNFVGNLKGELFDVIIIPTIVEDIAELNCVNANSLNVALTSSRYYCIMIGDRETLSSGGIWKEVVEYVTEQKLATPVDINVLTEVINKLETDVMDKSSDPADLQKMPGKEFTWDGRPIGAKDILADVRDQRGQQDTCVLQATSAAVESLMKLHNASLTPPQDCGWQLSVDDFKKKHEEGSGKKFTAEDSADRGKKRLITAFEIIKEHGVEARNKCNTKVVKISAYKEIVVDGKTNPKSTEEVKKLVEQGNVLIGAFRLSMNYFNLSPGQVYVFDERKPVKHPKSNLTMSHAVMMIGIGQSNTPRGLYFRHLCMQNSEGRLFGHNGLGRVAKKSVKNLFQIELEKQPGGKPF